MTTATSTRDYSLDGLMGWLWGMIAGLLGIYSIGTKFAFASEEDELTKQVTELQGSLRDIDRRLDAL